MDVGNVTSGLYYKIYDLVFTPLYRSKEVTVESIHRHRLSSVRWRKYDIANFIILATVRRSITNGDNFMVTVKYFAVKLWLNNLNFDDMTDLDFPDIFIVRK